MTHASRPPLLRQNRRTAMDYAVLSGRRNVVWAILGALAQNGAPAPRGVMRTLVRTKMPPLYCAVSCVEGG